MDLKNSNSSTTQPGQNEFKDHNPFFYTLLHINNPDWKCNPPIFVSAVSFLSTFTIEQEVHVSPTHVQFPLTWAPVNEVF